MNQINSFNTIWIAPTYRCNNDCEWCYARTNTREDLDIKYAERLARFLKSLDARKIVLIGGEPTIYSEIEGLIKTLSGINIPLGMVSNGRRFSDRIFTKLLKDSGLKFVTFSVEGYDSTSHDSVTRVAGSFDQAVEGIENTLLEGINTSTNTVISRRTRDKLEKIVDFLGKKVAYMSFNICGVCVDGDGKDSEMLSPQEAIVAFERVYDYAKTRGIRTKLVTPMPFCLFDASRLKEFLEKKIISGGPCQLKTGRNFVIESNGDIIPCTHFVGLPFMNIFEEEGIISREEFLTRYNVESGEPHNFRNHFDRYPSDKCNDKKCNMPCSGGCPLFWMKFDPEKEIKGIVAKE